MADTTGPAPATGITDEMVSVLVAKFKPVSEYRRPDPRDESAIVLFTATDGHTSMRPLTFGEIADALTAAGFAALAGRTPVELPTSVNGVFRPSARTVVAKVDQEGRPFVRIDGQLWLDGEAEDVGLAMVAAAHASRRLAGESSGDRSRSCSCGHAANRHLAISQQPGCRDCDCAWFLAAESSGDGEPS